MTEIELRPVTEYDSGFLFDLANDPDVAATSSYDTPIPQEEHDKWFAAKLADPTCTIMIAEIDGQPVGQIRSDLSGEGEILSVGVVKEHRGKGLGAQIISLQCREPGRYAASVFETNIVSLQVFKKAGFSEAGKDTEGRIKMVLEK